MYVQIIICLYMIIKSPKVAYIFNGVERTNRGKEGRRGSGPFESGFPYILPIDLGAFSLASLLAVSVVAPAELFPPARRDAENRERQVSYISETRIDIPSPGLSVARIIPPLSSFHEPATKYHRKLDIIWFFFLFFFRFCFKY